MGSTASLALDQWPGGRCRCRTSASRFWTGLSRWWTFAHRQHCRLRAACTGTQARLLPAGRAELGRCTVPHGHPHGVSPPRRPAPAWRFRGCSSEDTAAGPEGRCRRRSRPNPCLSARGAVRPAGSQLRRLAPGAEPCRPRPAAAATLKPRGWRRDDLPATPSPAVAQADARPLPGESAHLCAGAGGWWLPPQPTPRLEGRAACRRWRPAGRQAGGRAPCSRVPQLRPAKLPATTGATDRPTARCFGTDYFTRTAVAKSNIFVNKPNETQVLLPGPGRRAARA